MEGAKLLGAGAATIALAGAALGIGNVFSSLIHSVSRNPSIAKQLFGYAIPGRLQVRILPPQNGFRGDNAFMIPAEKTSKRKDQPIMYLLIVFLPLFGSFVAGFFGRFLGSEGSDLVSFDNLVFIGLMLFVFLSFFRFYSKRLMVRFGQTFFHFCYYTLFFSILLFFFYVRMRFSNYISLHFFLLLGVINPVSPLPGPTNSPPSSSSEYNNLWAAPPEPGWLDEFPPAAQAEGAAAPAQEEFPVEERASYTRNGSFERSIQQRWSRLSMADSPFLTDESWDAISRRLGACTSREYYEIQLHFENSDLMVREHRHSCYNSWMDLLSDHPLLADISAYAPEEVVKDFFDEERAKLDREYANRNFSVIHVDSKEMEFLRNVQNDVRTQGVNSQYLTQLLGLADAQGGG